MRDAAHNTPNGWTLHFLFRNTLAEIKMLIHDTPILSSMLWKLAWRTLVAEIARLSEEAGKKWGPVNELIPLVL